MSYDLTVNKPVANSRGPLLWFLEFPDENFKDHRFADNLFAVKTTELGETQSTWDRLEILVNQPYVSIQDIAKLGGYINKSSSQDQEYFKVADLMCHCLAAVEEELIETLEKEEYQNFKENTKMLMRGYQQDENFMLSRSLLYGDKIDYAEETYPQTKARRCFIVETGLRFDVLDLDDKTSYETRLRQQYKTLYSSCFNDSPFCLLFNLIDVTKRLVSLMTDNYSRTIDKSYLSKSSHFMTNGFSCRMMSDLLNDIKIRRLIEYRHFQCRSMRADRYMSENINPSKKAMSPNVMTVRETGKEVNINQPSAEKHAKIKEQMSTLAEQNDKSRQLHLVVRKFCEEVSQLI